MLTLVAVIGVILPYLFLSIYLLCQAGDNQADQGSQASLLITVRGSNDTSIAFSIVAVLLLFSSFFLFLDQYDNSLIASFIARTCTTTIFRTLLNFKVIRQR